MKKMVFIGLSFLMMGMQCKKSGISNQGWTVTGINPLSGNAGTFVTITGTGFSDDPNQDHVSFGLIKAPIITTSPTQMVVEVPVNPDSATLDSVLILVQISDGSTVYPANFTYIKHTPLLQVSTFAGGGFGNVNGAGLTAKFNNPEAGAFDRHGNLFVADYGNHEIRKVTPQGVVSTFAGSGTSGWLDAKGTAAQFDHPAGLAFDTHDNLYVSDQDNNRIRMIDTSGNVTTVAGSGYARYQDGIATVAAFNGPIGIGYDSVGNSLYIADNGNNMIRKIDLTSKNVSTFAGQIGFGGGDGYTDQPLTATFSSPRGITIGHENNALYVFVADYTDNKIREIVTVGSATSVFTLSGPSNNQSGFTDGTTMATYHQPNCTAIGWSKTGLPEFFIADASNHAIRYAAVDPTSVIAGDLPVQTLTGNGYSGLMNGTYAQAAFNYPDGVVFNRFDGNLYVIEFGNSDVRKIILQ